MIEAQRIYLPSEYSRPLNRGLMDAITTKGEVPQQTHRPCEPGEPGAVYDLYEDPARKDHPAVSDLRRIVLSYVSEDTIVQRAWVKYYHKGESCIPHTHGGIKIAATYYAQGLGQLHIEGESPITTTPGLLVLFNPDKQHWSSENNFDLPRVVFAFNLIGQMK